MLRRIVSAAALAALCACAPMAREADVAPAPAPAPPPAMAAFAHAPLSADALMEHVRALSADEFEGRFPGTHGEELTLAYLERAFAGAGLEPGVAGADGSRSFRQAVPLVSSAVRGAPQLTVTGRGGAHAYEYAAQHVVWTKRVVDRVSVENAPLVFVGYGVVAPERNWNDYAGVDMAGKIAVMLINDPDFGVGEDRGFGGQAMTYYGRWTYKFAEAARQGAAGAIIIHETAPASYPWAVVQSSWTGEQLDTVHEDRGMSRTQFEGWVTQEVGEEILRSAGQDFARLKARAQRQGFRPVPLRGATLSLSFEADTHESLSHNIVAVLPGRARAEEAVFFGAHWDHLGRCPAVEGDDICNGALDNATGTAGLIELARRAVADGPAERSMAFIAFTAEEQGLLGSQFFADNPTVAPANIAAMINMDGLSIYGPAHDITIVGYGKSEMDDLLTRTAEAAGRRVRPDQFPERGSFFRSDQFHFARVGVPVLYTDAGIDLVEGGEERGRAAEEDYIANRYHKPADEMSPDWNMAGATADLGLLYAVGRGVADGAAWPAWRADAEFAGVRAAQGR